MATLTMNEPGTEVLEQEDPRWNGDDDEEFDSSSDRKQSVDVSDATEQLLLDTLATYKEKHALLVWVKEYHDFDLSTETDFLQRQRILKERHATAELIEYWLDEIQMVEKELEHMKTADATHEVATAA